MNDWELDTPPQDGTRRDGEHRETTPVSPGGPDGPVAASAGDVLGKPPAPADAPRVAAGAGAAGVKTAKAGRRLRGRFPVAWVVGTLLALVAGVLMGFFIARSQTAEERAQLTEARDDVLRLTSALSDSEARNWQYYLSTQALEAEIEGLLTPTTTGQGGPSTTAQAPSFEPGTTYGDGVYLVGEDIAAGSYDGVVTGDIGYWARLKGTDGAVSSIVANGLPRGPFVLTIIASDAAVELRGVRLTAR